MEKLAGGVCILSGCMVLLVCWTEEMNRKIERMRQLVRFFQSWAYSLQVKQLRVPEFLENYVFEAPELQRVTKEVRQGLLLHCYPGGQEVWQQVMEKHKSALGLPEEAFLILLLAADGFFGNGSRQAKQCIEHCMEQMESVIAKEQESYRGKKGVYMPVAMLTGVMLIILLM